MDMYWQYVKEREGLEVLLCGRSFALYRLEKDCIYVQDIWVEPVLRNTGVGRKLLKMAEDIGNQHGKSIIMGSCDPAGNNSTGSLKALLATGFELSHVHNGLVYLVKPITPAGQDK